VTRIVSCGRERLEAILEILNDEIGNSTALYDYRPRTAAIMEDWFQAKERGSYPIIGIVADDDRLLGFGSYGPFRHWQAYKYTIEHSLYLEPGQRGKGLGAQLLGELIAAARGQDYHTLIGGIDAQNTASIALHRKMGFELCGTIRHAGFKFDRWLDLQFYQLLLDTPSRPAAD
jgi:L-amino acid N-acyltransferase YncA